MRQHHVTRIDDRIGATRLFAGLTTRQLRQVAACSTELTVPAGRVLCRQGRCRLELVVILAGEALATTDGTPVGILGQGAHLGAHSVAAGAHSGATVTTLTTTDVLVISAGELTELASKIPAIRHRLATGGDAPVRTSVPEAPARRQVDVAPSTLPWRGSPAHSVAATAQAEWIAPSM